MKKQKLTPANILLGLVFAFIFAFMLYCNIKTPMIHDDYGYCFSFADGARIESISQIFPSMVAHRHTMNGRVISHFLLQLFLMLPMLLFKLVNSAMFVAMIAVICKFAFFNKERPALLRPLTAFAVFAATWVFQPVFGEAFLWEAGSVNYLWAAVIAFSYIYVCMVSFTAGREPHGVVAVIAFLLLSFVAGAYSETCAITVIVVSFLFSVQTYFVKKRKPSKLMLASFACLIIGFAFLFFAPAEGINKLTGSMDMEHILDNIKTMAYFCISFWPLIVATDVLLIAAICAKVDRDTIHAAVTLLFAAAAIMIALTVSLYVPERVLTMPCLILVVVCTILTVELFSKSTFLSMVAQTLPILMSFYFLACGLDDIIQTDFSVRMNEQIIMEDIEAGKTESNLEMLKSSTKYFPLCNLTHVTSNPDNWVNASMAKYYGIDQIIGVKHE